MGIYVISNLDNYQRIDSWLKIVISIPSIMILG